MNAEQITAGQTFTDNMGHTHTALRIENAPGGAGVYVYIVGQGYPEFYTWGTPVTVTGPAKRIRPAVDPKPFKVYTRDYNTAGDCDKRIFSFATRAAQSRFVSRTNRCVTFTN